jgi:DNA-binding response OmpR family regulator
VDKRRILVIDDEVDLGRMIKANLERTGRFEVRTESHPAAGIRAVEAFQPELVLLDVVMPDMEGSEVADKIRALPGFERVPIVFLTAIVTREETAASGGSIGGIPFLAKPVRLEELVQAIETHLDGAA